jgi:hypothetical protein
MALFKITVNQTKVSNGIRLEKGTSVDVPSNYSNPLTTNGGHEVIDAFLRVYGVDLKKYGGGSVLALSTQLDVKKIS